MEVESLLNEELGPYAVLWTNAPAAAGSITAVATDTNNSSGRSAQLPVSVGTQ